LILLDANVISELTREAPDRKVLAFLRRQPQATLFTSCICEAEVRYGLARMPIGRRRKELVGRVEVLFMGFGTRILPFDSASATLYGTIRVARQSAGKPISVQDAMIAATARAYGVAIATRNVGDFVGCGARVVNPWTEQDA
jgi:predicted nucleic acid-binding protein